MYYEYTETSNLLHNGNAGRRKVTIRAILLYTVISASILVLYILLLVHLLKAHNTVTSTTTEKPTKQMVLVNSAAANRVSSKFANWAIEELEGIDTRSLGDCEPVLHNSSMSDDDDLPDAVDWRKRGVIGDVIAQRECNVCWQISIVQVIESMVAIRRKASQVTPLSIQELIDCSYRPKGCMLGDPRSALSYMTKNNMSIVTNEEYPLSLREEECRYENRLYPKGVRVKKFNVACHVTDKYIMRLLANHGPLIATVDSINWKYYNGGILTWHCQSWKKSNHVVQIVGYDRTGDIPYYIVKNSWGTDFGDNGYVYVEMGRNLCGIEEYITYLDVEY